MSDSLCTDKRELNDAIKKSVERVRWQDDVAHIALIPDVDLAKGVCVGAVVATH